MDVIFSPKIRRNRYNRKEDKKGGVDCKREAMSGDGPVIKFSPFEALLIGEHNSIIKRKPMKNTVYLTNLNHKRKEFNLRELFDVKDDKDLDKKKKKIKKIQKCIEVESKFHSLRLRQKQNMKKERRIHKKNPSNRVRFKPEFRFRETLEERIVQKIQKRKKKLKTNLVGNGIVCQLKKPHPNRHSLRGKNGQFIRREDREKAEASSSTSHSRNTRSVRTDEKPKTKTRTRAKPKTTIKTKTKTKIDSPKSDDSDSDRSKCCTDSVLNEISLQYYPNAFPEEFGLPTLPKKFETTDFEQDNDLKGILDESCKDEKVEGGGGGGGVNDDDDDDDEVEDKKPKEDEDSNLPGQEFVRRREGLKMYERKRTDKNKAAIFQKNAKENHFISKNSRCNTAVKNNAVSPTKKNGVTCLIDERPAKSNHLIWNNKFRSLFYKTAFGSEMYLGNLNKTVVLNSTFGRLPDIS